MTYKSGGKIHSKRSGKTKVRARGPSMKGAPHQEVAASTQRKKDNPMGRTGGLMSRIKQQATQMKGALPAAGPSAGGMAGGMADVAGRMNVKAQSQMGGQGLAGQTQAVARPTSLSGQVQQGVSAMTAKTSRPGPVKPRQVGPRRRGT